MNIIHKSIYIINYETHIEKDISNLRYTMMIFHFRLEPWHLNLLKMLHSSPKSIEISD